MKYLCICFNLKLMLLFLYIRRLSGFTGKVHQKRKKFSKINLWSDGVSSIHLRQAYFGDMRKTKPVNSLTVVFHHKILLFNRLKSVFRIWVSSLQVMRNAVAKVRRIEKLFLAGYGRGTVFLFPPVGFTGRRVMVLRDFTCEINVL